MRPAQVPPASSFSGLPPRPSPAEAANAARAIIAASRGVWRVLEKDAGTTAYARAPLAHASCLTRLVGWAPHVGEMNVASAFLLVATARESARELPRELCLAVLAYLPVAFPALRVSGAIGYSCRIETVARAAAPTNTATPGAAMYRAKPGRRVASAAAAREGTPNHTADNAPTFALPQEDTLVADGMYVVALPRGNRAADMALREAVKAAGMDGVIVRRRPLLARLGLARDRWELFRLTPLRDLDGNLTSPGISGIDLLPKGAVAYFVSETTASERQRLATALDLASLLLVQLVVGPFERVQLLARAAAGPCTIAEAPTLVHCATGLWGADSLGHWVAYCVARALLSHAQRQVFLQWASIANCLRPPAPPDAGVPALAVVRLCLSVLGVQALQLLHAAFTLPQSASPFAHMQENLAQAPAHLLAGLQLWLMVELALWPLLAHLARGFPGGDTAPSWMLCLAVRALLYPLDTLRWRQLLMAVGPVAHEAMPFGTAVSAFLLHATLTLARLGLVSFVRIASANLADESL